MPSVRAVDLNDDIRCAAVHMGDQRALVRLLVDVLHGLTCQIIQAVDILFGMLDGNLGARLLDVHNCLKHKF